MRAEELKRLADMARKGDTEALLEHQSIVRRNNQAWCKDGKLIFSEAPFLRDCHLCDGGHAREWVAKEIGWGSIPYPPGCPLCIYHEIGWVPSKYKGQVFGTSLELEWLAYHLDRSPDWKSALPVIRESNLSYTPWFEFE